MRQHPLQRGVSRCSEASHARREHRHISGLFGHSGDSEALDERTKAMLDDMHKRKIDLADEIFVINVDGYIGASTRSEIEYAVRTGKTVKYLYPENDCIIKGDKQ